MRLNSKVMVIPTSCVLPLAADGAAQTQENH